MSTDAPKRPRRAQIVRPSRVSRPGRRLTPTLEAERLEERKLLAVLPDGFSESVVATGLNDPTAMALSPDDRVWVLNQGGEVKVFHDGSSDGWSALTIPASAINREAERGLLGIAFDPSYNINDAAPDYVYLYYTATSPVFHNQISRFTVDNSNPDQPVLTDEKDIVDLDPLSYTQHNGGALNFGPDGKLYVAVGDGANPSNAQDLSNRFGKILRYNPDGTIPADNPTSFPGIEGTTLGANRAIWAVGLRNPFTFTFQPGTGKIYINDVGQDHFEEIDTGSAGSNFGWPLTEGDFNQADHPDFTRPVYNYPHNGTTFEVGSVIAGSAFYNPTDAANSGDRFPEKYTGKYFFADGGEQWIHVLDLATGQVTPFATDTGNGIGLAVDSQGGLIYLARSEDKVFRIISSIKEPPTITQPPTDQTAGLGGTATFSVASGGSSPLSYQWQRAEAGTSDWIPIDGATSDSYTIDDTEAEDDGDRFRVVVTNPFGSRTSTPATLHIEQHHVPTAKITIDSGLTDGKFVSGQPIQFTVAGQDDAGEAIDADHLSWRVEFISSIRTGKPVVRPFVAESSGTSTSVFTPATNGPYSLADVTYRIVLTATDASGLSTTISKDISPVTAKVTVTTVPAGLKVTVDGQPFTTPYSFVGVAGFQRSISVTASQVLDGKTYMFTGFSDGGASSHPISTPLQDTTYTAKFEVQTSPGEPTTGSGGGSVVSAASEPDYQIPGQTNVAIYVGVAGSFAFRRTDNQPDVVVPFGLVGPGQTIATLGDYDGDRKADLAAYIPAYGVYAYRPSSGGPDVLASFGIAGAGQTIPAPGDYEGTGRDDLAVYMPAFGTFGIRPAAGGDDKIIPFGLPGAGQTLPAPADYFGTGRDAIAAYLPALGVFAVRPPSGEDIIVPFGLPGLGQSIPVVGDYDGDDVADLAVYMPNLGVFAYRPSSGGPDVLQAFGPIGGGTIPMPGDYDGSGKTELAIYNQELGVFAFRPSGGAADVIIPFGLPGLGASVPVDAPAGSVTYPDPLADAAAAATVQAQSLAPPVPAGTSSSAARASIANANAIPATTKSAVVPKGPTLTAAKAAKKLVAWKADDSSEKSGRLS